MRFRLWLIYFGVLVCFVCDRAAKQFFLHNPSERFGGDFILEFYFARNDGIAFGVPIHRYLIVGVTAVVVIGLLYWIIRLYHQRDVMNTLGVTLIVGGAVSNMVDRLRHGFVIDYISVPYFSVLNIADVCITLGAALLIAHALFEKRPRTTLDN